MEIPILTKPEELVQSSYVIFPSINVDKPVNQRALADSQIISQNHFKLNAHFKVNLLAIEPKPLIQIQQVQDTFSRVVSEIDLRRIFLQELSTKKKLPADLRLFAIQTVK
jgi:hypothetical protein